MGDKKQAASQSVIDDFIADVKKKEAERKANRPEMKLPGGETLYFEESDIEGWCWTSDVPVFKEPGGREFSVVIHVDEEGDHPSEDQLARLREVIDHLPDLLRQFKERLPEECLEFDAETSDPPAKFEELGGWELWFEAPAEEEEWSILCEMEEEGTPSYTAKFEGLALEVIEPCY